MANFKLKDGLVVGSNGIIFSDSTVQTTAASFTPTITSVANNDTLVYVNGVWINTAGPFDITEGALSSKTFNSFVTLSNGSVDNFADLTINRIVATSTATTANTANLNFNSTVSSKSITEGLLPTTNVLSGTYGSATQVGQFTVDDKGRITNATGVSIELNASSITSGTLNNARTTSSSSNGASTIVARDASGSFNANTITCTTLTQTSSIIYKENFRILNDPLNLLIQLQAYVYDRKDGSTKNEPGLILEDVKDILPYIVSEDGISYTRLTVYLLEGIKQLKKEIENLKLKIF